MAAERSGLRWKDEERAGRFAMLTPHRRGGLGEKRLEVQDDYAGKEVMR